MAKKTSTDNTVEDVVAEAVVDYEGYVQGQAQSIWSYDELPFDLNMEEHLFVRSYIIDRNPVAAGRRLGLADASPNMLKARAAKMLAKTEVMEALEWLAKRMMEKLDITAERVQRKMAAIAFFDPREVMTFDGTGMHLMHSRYWTEEQAAAIQSIKMGQHGLELKMYDRLRANEMLAKQLGVQPDDSDSAEVARAVAEGVMGKILTAFDRQNGQQAGVAAPVRQLPGDEDGPTVQ